MRGNRIRGHGLAGYIVLSVFAVPTLFPIYVMLNMAGKDLFQYTLRPLLPTFPYHFENYLYAWQFLARSFFNNLVIIGVSTTIVLLLASMTAYALARHSFPGKRFVFYAILCVLAIPATVIMVPQFMLVVQLGVVNTLFAVMLPYAAHQSLVIIVLYTSFSQLNESMFEAARIDGAGHLRIFTTIVIPLSKPILAAMAIFEVWWLWNDYAWPSLVLSSARLRTVALQLVTFVDGMAIPQPGQEMAANVIAALPIVLLFLFSMKTFISGITSGAVKL